MLDCSVFVQCRFQVLTERFLPIQCSVTRQAVVETSSPCTTGDTQQHLLQVCHRLTEKTVRFYVGDRRIFLGENCLTLAARHFTLHLGDDVLISVGVRRLAIHLILLRGDFMVRGGGGRWGVSMEVALLLLCFYRIFGRFFSIPQGLRGSLARLRLMDLLELPLLLLKCLLQALLILLVMLQQGSRRQAH